MSCHDIGRGMNEVVRMTISLLDKGEIEMEPAKKIIATCRAAVNWWDGNEEEASLYISNCRCGKCMKIIPIGEKLLSLYSFDDIIGLQYRDYRTEHIVSDKVCEQCFDELVTKYSDDVTSAKEATDKRLEGMNSKEYISEGAYQNDNNGCRWVRGTDWFD